MMDYLETMERESVVAFVSVSRWNLNIEDTDGRQQPVT